MGGSGKITFYEHPGFQENEDQWKTYRDLYEGNHNTLTSYKYLWPHELELSSQGGLNVDPVTKQSESVGQRIRRIRAMRSRYLNMFEPIVSNLIAMAFKKPMEVDASVEKMLGDDIEDIDGKGTSLQSFITGPLAIAYFRDGKPIVYVDAPTNNAFSAGEEKAAGFRPYMEVLDVLEVPDWQISKDGGKYDWLRYEFEVVEERASAQEEPQEVEYCKILAIEGGQVVVRVYREDEEKEDWVFVSEVVLDGWKELPLSTCWNNESWVKDVAELQLVLYNLMSAYYNQLNTQAFQRIFVAGDLGEKHQISISEYAISQIPPEAKPYVIEPSNPQGLVDAINSTADQIYKVAFNRTRSLPAGSKEAPGATTIQEMNVELTSVLKQALEEIESIINSALKHFAMFKLGPEKGAAFEGKVTLAKDIDQQGVTDRLQVFLAYRDEIRKVLPWRKAEMRRAAGEMGYSDEELQQIQAEIEALKAEPVINPMAGLAPFTNRGNAAKDPEENEPVGAESDGGQQGSDEAGEGSET